MSNVLKCNVYCTSVEKFAAVNAIYALYFPENPPARIFVCVPAWPGPFYIEMHWPFVRPTGLPTAHPPSCANEPMNNFLGKDPASTRVRHRAVDPQARARFAAAIKSIPPHKW